VAEDNQTREAGYGKPPEHMQFVKGRSGNPKGRPKGSRNLGTILAKTGRERVTVTENGKRRYISKSEAAVLQLWNKAAAGDLSASKVLLSWLTSQSDPDEVALSLAAPDEKDAVVMASIIKRIRQGAEEHPSGSATDPAAEESTKAEV